MLWHQVLGNQLPRDAPASRSTVADLPALFADLVRLQIELWDAVQARLRVELGVGLGTAQTPAVVRYRADPRGRHDTRQGAAPDRGRARRPHRRRPL
jgi:hypothetical protein